MLEIKLIVDNRGTVFEEPAVTFTRGVCGGDPCVPGTRITAAHLYECHRKLGWSVEKLVEEYPELSWAQVSRALQWIQEHPGYWVDWIEGNDI